MQNSHGGSLEFVFDETLQKPVARTDTNEMILDEPFEFDTYQNVTNTLPFPRRYQDMIQSAIEHEVCERARAICLDEVASITSLPYSLLPTQIGHMPKFVGIVALIAEYADMLPFCLKSIQATLLPHQKQALEYAVTRPRCILALDMGLGKTLIAICYIVALQLHRTLLIVPSGLKDNWKDEFEHFLHPGTNLHLIELTTAKECASILHDNYSQTDKNNVFMVSSTLLANVAGDILHYKWNAIICDEAHMFRNEDSKCSQALLTIARFVPHVLLLSGTPAWESIGFYHLLKIMHPVIFETFFGVRGGPQYDSAWLVSTLEFRFVDRYIRLNKNYIRGGRQVWSFRDSSRLDELHFVMRQWMLVQKKKDVLDLPPFIREHITIGSLSELQRAMLEEKYSRFSQLLNKDLLKAQTLFTECVMDTAHAKLPFTLAYITLLLQTSDVRFIVWAHHKFALKAIDEHLTKLKINHIYLIGKTSKINRAKRLKHFKNDPSVRCGVFSIKALGTGINAAFVPLCVYAELVFDYVSQSQSECRIYRIGQTAERVVAQYLMLKHSMDSKIWNSTARKTANEGKALTNNRGMFEAEKLSCLVSHSRFCDEDESVNEIENDAVVSSISSRTPSFIHTSSIKIEQKDDDNNNSEADSTSCNIVQHENDDDDDDDDAPLVKQTSKKRRAQPSSTKIKRFKSNETGDHGQQATARVIADKSKKTKSDQALPRLDITKTKKRKQTKLLSGCDDEEEDIKPVSNLEVVVSDNDALKDLLVPCPKRKKPSLLFGCDDEEDL